MYSSLPDPLLLAVPNASAGRDEAVAAEIARALAPIGGSGVRLLDVHRDADHDRSVFTLAGRQGEIARALVRGARAAVERIDLRAQTGVHPRVGALDVAPVVYRDDAGRGAACAEALTAAALIAAELELPVFLYGDLATSEAHRERASLRAGGPEALAARIESGELRPDYGPARAHPSAGALLVTARAPLVAFNLELESDDLGLAREIAAALRESGGGFPGVRALGLALADRRRAQVSFNVHDHRAVALHELVAATRAWAPVACAELVGLAPAAAFEGFPADLPVRGFDPARHLLENALGSDSSHGEDQGKASPQASRHPGGHGPAPA
ncbi:MAG: Glutamate formiminotransferase @ Glutamate formyltransferase [uncultured Solirubrobacterales bacterium]|uniref:glutamate formimidoyltransferase n=1 Tax=uncultured Solirubrobacterales bacterium TaxID=768556 RepID=A0A6J4SZV9_9ACTN|nr:MAG: Glutamate formiminotransferase @ Glutamate formyltransferase [uncultured Solirubrobacterales bacterium]